MLISITRLELKSLAMLPVFIWHALRSRSQAGRAEGLIQVRVDAENWRTYWTVTSWETLEQMMAYRNSGPHLSAMKHWRAIATAAESHHYDEAIFPGVEDSRRILHQAVGR